VEAAVVAVLSDRLLCAQAKVLYNASAVPSVSVNIFIAVALFAAELITRRENLSLRLQGIREVPAKGAFRHVTRV
jgi:hypothetical protein